MHLQTLLNLQHPLIQAPMAGSQNSTLAIAVSSIGALGSLPCAMLTPETLDQELRTIRDKTANPVNLNFFAHQPPVLDRGRAAVWKGLFGHYYHELEIDPDAFPPGPMRMPFNDDMADVLCAYPPKVVSFHFGLPDGYLLDRVRSTGAKILSSATTVEEAIWLEQQGVDAIIAQGVEAGGHRGMFLSDDISTQIGTFALLPQVLDAVKVPVIAAGGIADARGVKAAVDLGAAGVQVGTAYLCCPEATTSAIHRAALQSPQARHTALTNIYSGRPARGIVNRMMRELGPMNPLAPAFPLATAASAPLRAKAESQGSGDFTPLWSGQNASGCKPIPAADLTRELLSLL